MKILTRYRTPSSASIGRTMKRKESFVGIGTVEVRPFEMVNGEKQYITDLFTKHNLIVKKGRASLIDLLIGAKSLKLQYIRWGKGGALAFPAGDPLQPLDVVDTNEDVAQFVIDKLLSAPERVSDTEVAYNETLISDEVNSNINEAALFLEEASTLNRTIFARITFPTIPLQPGRGTGIELRWLINFTRADEA